MQLEIGGGTRNRGVGWVNLDICPTADIVHNLDVLPWPLADESADNIYTSHCIEHVASHIDFIREVARIGKVGAHVEIRCPDALSEMAMVYGHRGVFSINVVRHLDHIFPEMHWTGCKRRLRLQNIEKGPDDYWFPLARKNPIFKAYSDDDILHFVPRTLHENRFHFFVEAM